MQKVYSYNDMGEITKTLSKDKSVNKIAGVGIHTAHTRSKTIFHEGHIDLLQKARQKCDILIFALYPRCFYEMVNGITDYSVTSSPSAFESELEKLTSSVNIDYIIAIDADPTMLGTLSKHYNYVKDNYSEFLLEDNYITRADITLRFYYYFGELIKSGKYFSVNGIFNAYQNLINWKISRVTGERVGRRKFGTTYMLSAPAYRNSDGLLPERTPVTKETYNLRLSLHDCLKNLNISAGDDVKEIEAHCKKECNISDGRLFNISFADFNTVSLSPTITDYGLLQAKMNNEGDTKGYENWLEEKMLFGMDETKWHKFSDNGVEEINEADL